VSPEARGRCSFRSLGGGEIELDVAFGIGRDTDSWLEKVERPTMLVTGASGFIGRYMVDLLVGFGYKVFATDIGSRPAYLSQAKYKAVEYAPADLREEEAVDFLMKWVRPTVVFHIGAIFDFSASAQLLRAVNVTGTERVCDAARNAGAKRVIYWSTGSIYGPSDTPALETGPKDPADPYAASKLEGEYAAFAFHEPPTFEVYSVRPAMVSGILSRYGSGLVTRLMYEGYLIGPPQRRGMMNAVVNARDVATCGYLLATRDLRIDAQSSDDTAFNAAADPVSVDEMMRALGAAVPKRHVFGVRTKLAEIISFGFQEEVRLPDKMVRLIGAASSVVTGVLNQFRLAKLHPKIPPQTVPYMTSPHPMSNAKARELLGWTPDAIDVDLEETSRYYEVTGWSGFERRFSAEEAGRIRLFDEVEGLINALNRRRSFALSALGADSPDADESSDECPRIALPSLALEIDVRSLEILIHAGRAHILEQAYRGRFSDLISGTMPRLASQAADDATLYLKYAYSRAFGGGGFPEVGLIELIKNGLALDRDRIVSWILAANLARVFEVARGCGDLLRRLSDLLPEGGYALMLETGFGDIAIEYTKGPEGHSLQFIREELDGIPKHLRLDDRVERLRKARGLKLVLGALFDDVVRVFASGADDGGEASQARSFGGVLDRMVCSPPDVLRRISGKVGRSGWTKLLFEDATGRISIGINLNDEPVFMSPERLESYDIARRILTEDGFSSAMDAASEGSEKVFVYSVDEFRKLLSDAMSTGIVSRLLGR
jgi:nucleoside-diphosphate-sugar epimerase